MNPALLTAFLLASAGGLQPAWGQHHPGMHAGSSAVTESSTPTTPETTAPSTPKAETTTPAYTPVVTPGGTTLKWTMENGVKVFRLVAEPVRHEFAPGMVGNCWGYNGHTPGPTIEAVEGDRVRIYVTNKLPEPTTIHWHGLLLPSGMDGVGGLSQRYIQPGETYAYEFTLRQHGTQMYHPHADETFQMAMGMMGFFIIHPKEPPKRRVDRDFAIMLMEWFVRPGTYTPDPSVMTDFNTFTFNSRAFPGTSPMVARKGDRVRIRLANLSMDSHPIHLHGFHFRQTGTDGGPTPPSAQFPITTINVPVGETRDIEFDAEFEGDWAFHCHKNHHAMNAMEHELPVMLNVDQSGLQERIRKLLPGYMPMASNGMHEMVEMEGMMPGPDNTLLMMMGKGPHGPIAMGGMFTILKVREGLKSYADPGWYKNPTGTEAWVVKRGKPPKKVPGMHGQGHGGAQPARSKMQGHGGMHH